jgi:glyceraldehyde 3-phosphate dehydrogenase
LPAIVDISFTKVVDGNLVKVLVWYDNEWAYTATLIMQLSKIK